MYVQGLLEIISILKLIVLEEILIGDFFLLLQGAKVSSELLLGHYSSKYLYLHYSSKYLYLHYSSKYKTNECYLILRAKSVLIDLFQLIDVMIGNFTKLTLFLLGAHVFVLLKYFQDSSCPNTQRKHFFPNYSIDLWIYHPIFQLCNDSIYHLNVL